MYYALGILPVVNDKPDPCRVWCERMTRPFCLLTYPEMCVSAIEGCVRRWCIEGQPPVTPPPPPPLPTDDRDKTLQNALLIGGAVLLLFLLIVIIR